MTKSFMKKGEKSEKEQTQRINKIKAKKKALSGLLSSSRFILIFGICFIILYPFIKKILTSVMSPADLLDPTVQHIARSPSFYLLSRAVNALKYKESFMNSLILSFVTAFLQTVVCSVVAYGFAKFKTKLSMVVFGLVIFSLLIPPRLILTPLFLQFRYFNFFGLQLKLIDSYAPFIILSSTCQGIKNGLYVYMLKQFFTGMPIELEEASYVDGYGVYKTFFFIMLPNAVPMMVTVFLFSFAWQWTDVMYVQTFFVQLSTLSKAVINNINAINVDASLANATRDTAVLIVIIPLIILYVFSQKAFVQSVERSGIVG